ncbi:hypothetical protein [Pseudomonas syringae]|uniref:type IV pilus biogenesis protein PilI n=1 Tax=Pseudomonas syringae TaxID=317 RepID=UPI001F169822|nr:hypothetical protein [Pseudomonas syringae]
MTPDIENFEVTVRTNSGTDKTHPASDLAAAMSIAKKLRTPDSYMVCIVQNGVRTMRWDRPTFVGENKWRKVSPDAFELLGQARSIVRVSRTALLQCYQVGEGDWFAATSPEQALKLMHQLEGEEEMLAYDVVLSTDEALDQGWAEPNDPDKCVGTLREWLASAKKPGWLAGTGS